MLDDDDETTDERRAQRADGSSEDLTRTWGHYRLEAKVGSGAFGKVYRAWDPDLEREVAIKILHGFIADSRLKERLLREGRALAKVGHPNVVTLFGVESHGDRIGLCMEFVRGETLEQALRAHGTLNAREAALIGEDVCRALAAVHRAGFVHRDVKARNVMRDAAGRIVLMDFGAGRQADGVQNLGDLAGTPVYMAPEVLAHQPPSPSSDVYSVGVLLYHLVTAEYPVVGRTMDDVRLAHARGERRLLTDRRPELPHRFIQVVDRALAPDPRDRYASAGALLEALVSLGERKGIAYLRIAALAIGGTVCLAMGLGILSSAQFNRFLERSAFVDEGIRDWFTWGVKSLIGPLLLALQALVGIALVIVLRRLLLTAFARFRDLDAAVRQRVLHAAAGLHLDDPSVLASFVLLCSTLALFVGWWYFWPLITALAPSAPISTVPAREVAFLSPVFDEYHINYRITFIWILIVSVALWYPVVRLSAKTGHPVNRALLVGGAAVALFALATLDLPYRLLYFNDFDVMTWQGQRCYSVAERRSSLLLMCPDLQPRTRVVNGDDAALERTGIRESVFARFAKTP